MPEELKKYFWDTDFQKLDIEKNKRYIIARLYCYGDLRAIKWVKETYSKVDIEDTARNCRNLKPIVANYLRQQYNLKKEEMAYYRAIMAMNYDFWRGNCQEQPKFQMALEKYLQEGINARINYRK